MSALSLCNMATHFADYNNKGRAFGEHVLTKSLDKNLCV